jgi:hypothetical protein
LESTDVDKDIGNFVNSKSTGNQVPGRLTLKGFTYVNVNHIVNTKISEHVKFENYFDTNPEATAVLNQAEQLEQQFQREEEEKQKADEEQRQRDADKEELRSANMRPASEVSVPTMATAAAAAAATAATKAESRSSLESNNRNFRQKEELPVDDHELKSHHEAIASALHQVETMLDDVTSPTKENRPLSGAPITSPSSDHHSAILSPSMRDESVNRAPIADSFVKQRSSDWFGTPYDNQQNYSHGQQPQMSPSDSYTSDTRNTFLPMINPHYLHTQERSSEHSTSRSSLEQQQQPISGKNGSSFANEHLQKQNENYTKPLANAKYEEEGEDSDDNQPIKDAPRPPPKDEKWVISSIRRPQQVPVRAQNAKMYESLGSPVSEQTSFDQTFSTSGYSELPEQRQNSSSHMREVNEADEPEYDNEPDAFSHRHSKQQPNLKIAIPPGQKRESVNEPKDAASNNNNNSNNNDTMNNVRNQLHLASPDSDSANVTRDSMIRMFGRDNNIPSGPQQQYPGQGSMSPPQSMHDMNNNQQGRMEGQTMGIRAPPWQQQSDRQNGHQQNGDEQPMSQYLTSYPSENLEQQNGKPQNNVGRMNSVSGPRMPNQNLSKGSKLPPSELLSMKLAAPGPQQERQDWGGPENMNGRGNMYGPNNGYAYNDELDANMNSGKPNKMGPLDKMKIALRNPSDPRWPDNGSPNMADKANQRSSLPAEKASSNKEGKGGRFSLAIFGKKDKESKKNKEEREQYPISGSSSLGRVGGNQYAMNSPRQESLSYPVTTNNQTFSSMPDMSSPAMNSPSWQREQHQQRELYSDVSDPPRTSQSLSQKSSLPPTSAKGGAKELDDGTPVIEYGNELIMYI